MLVFCFRRTRYFLLSLVIVDQNSGLKVAVHDGISDSFGGSNLGTALVLPGSVLGTGAG